MEEKALTIKPKKKSTWKKLCSQWQLYVMMAPASLLLLVVMLCSTVSCLTGCGDKSNSGSNVVEGDITFPLKEQVTITFTSVLRAILIHQLLSWKESKRHFQKQRL